MWRGKWNEWCRKRDSNPRPRHYEPRIPHVAQLRCGALQFTSYRVTTFARPLGSMLGERIPANRLEPARNPVNARNWNRAGTAVIAGRSLVDEFVWMMTCSSGLRP